MFAVLGPMSAHARRSIAALGSALALAACQTFSPDGGLSVASDVAGKELRKDVVFIQTEDDASAVRARVRHMIGRTLTAEAAVQIALLNNRGLKPPITSLGSPRPCASGSRCRPTRKSRFSACPARPRPSSSAKSSEISSR